jgi:hypothetical protein
LFTLIKAGHKVTTSQHKHNRKELQMSKLPFQPNCPVVVVLSCKEAYEFSNLEEAKKHYPDLDPNVNGKNFTWAMHDKVNNQPAMRFESWEADAIFSR